MSKTLVKILIETDRIELLPAIRGSLPDGARMQVLLAGGEHGPRPLEMTARQQQIFELLMQNLSNKEIGRALSLSHFTVRNHVSQILRLLDVSSRGAAIAKSAGLSRQRS